MTGTCACKIEGNSRDVLSGPRGYVHLEYNSRRGVRGVSCLSAARDNGDTRGCFTGGGDTPRYHRARQHPVDGNTC